MAEVIGLAASLITLVGASAELAKTLRKVANVMESAEYEAHLIATDISVLSCTLTQLSKVVDLAHPESHKLREITTVLMNTCNILIMDLRKLIGEPISFHTTRRTLLMPYLRLRYRWMRNGRKVMFIKSFVDSFKTTIILLVSTIDLATAIHEDAPEPIKECLKTQVESNISFAEDASETLLKRRGADDMEKCDRTIEAAKAPFNDSCLMDGDAKTVSDSNSVLSITAANEERQIMLRAESTLDARDPGTVDNYTDEMNTENLQLASRCHQIIQIQKDSCDLAKALLQKPTVQQTWNWTSTQPSPVIKEFGGGRPTVKTEEQHNRSRRDSSIVQEHHRGSVGDDANITGGAKTRMQGKLRHHVLVDQERASDHGKDGVEVSEEDTKKRPESLGNDKRRTSKNKRSEKQASWSDGEDSVTSYIGKVSDAAVKDDFIAGRDSVEDFTSTAPDFELSYNHGLATDKAEGWEYALPTRPDLYNNLLKPGVENTFVSRPSSSPAPRSPPPKEDSILSKLEKLLLTKAEEDEKDARAAREAAADAKLSRLEKILISQQEAKNEKEKQKHEVAQKAARLATEAKKKGDEDKLAKLEKLILAQKDEQSKREAALEAQRAVEKAEADALAVKIAVETKAAADKAKELLDAAREAREEAERKALRDAEEAAKAHTLAPEEVRKTERMQLEARIAKEPVIIEDIIGRQFSCPWHLCNTPNAMEDFIRENSVGIPDILQPLESGNYDMVKSNMVIPPRLWKDEIFPGSSIKMKARTPTVSSQQPPSRPVSSQKNADKKSKWHKLLHLNSSTQSLTD